MDIDSLTFIEALDANGPAVDRAEQMMLYGQFIGAWEGTVTVWRADGEIFESSCEAHFGWALQGRAVQDVWMIPARRARRPGEGDHMYGSTLRILDPDTGEWNIRWADPVRQVFNEMKGYRAGSEIVQEYRDRQGTIVEWRFTDIERDSFRWISRESTDERATWRLTAEYRYHRVPTAMRVAA